MFRDLVVNTKKVKVIMIKSSFRQSKRFNMLKKYFENSVNEKQVLKIKILGNIWFFKLTLQHVFPKR